MKKILIVTLYNGLNCGAFLQAYSLMSFLENQGYKVDFYNGGARHPASTTFWDMLQSIKHINIKRAIYLFNQYRLLKKAQSAFNIVNTYKKNDYDCVIFGSDEIWNLKRAEIRNYPYLWGKDLDHNNRISYAPSTGFSKVSDLSTVNGFSDELRNFKAISVRDYNSQHIIEEVLGKKPNIVLDPTFLIEHRSYSYKGEKYVLLYGYSLYYNKEYKQEIIKFARENNLNIYSMGAYCSWSNLAAHNSPDNFLKYFNHAEYVITDTFHGTVFSIINQKQFIVLSAQGSNKILGLLKMINLENRYCEGKISLYKELVEKKIEWKKIEKDLLEIKKQSVEYLLSNI